MKTLISTDRTAAVELLRSGEIVALPTETVYGLAADALNPLAVAKIFEAKERPRFDPLIVHLPDPQWLEKIADIPVANRELIIDLATRFWPGPLTMVLPKRNIVPEIVTAGLDTVAVRISANPVFAAIVQELDEPLAAPSANRFGRISPTSAQHALEELEGRMPLIIDGGPTEHGIESTIVAIRDAKIEILRRGPVTAEKLRSLGFQLTETIGTDTDAMSIRAPGQLPSHYAPSTPLRLVEDAKTCSFDKGQRIGLLAWTTSGDSPANVKQFVAVQNLSERHDLREAAANLFRYLRELDALGLDFIVAERVPSRGLGAAIMDRLTRAAQRSALLKPEDKA